MKYKDYPNILQRKVGEETSRTFKQKLENGFFDKFMSGKTIEVGYAGYIGAVPIFPDTVGLNLGDANYDGVTIPYANETFDALYSSHVLEHIDDRMNTLKEWFRVVKVGGFMVVVVPHRDLYEKRLSKPSKWNGDHRIFYTTSLLVKEIEDALGPNSHRIRFLEEGDFGYDYNLGPEHHMVGQGEITIVLEKIKQPAWNIL